MSKSIKERVKQLVEMKPRDSCDVYDHLCVEFEALAHEIRNDALEDAAKLCNAECERRVTKVGHGHEYPAVLLGEASGATHCAHKIRELKEADIIALAASGSKEKTE
jgi:hypothetical protein